MEHIEVTNLTDTDLQELKAALHSELNTRPPSIGLVGVSGVGKSSTVNSMFKTKLAVSHTVACTKEFEETQLSLHMHRGEMVGEEAHLIVVDAPGLGEDIELDPKYIEMYKTHLKSCDVILWILSARNRAMALDQSYLRHFANFHDRMVFGVNQVDLVHPMNWNMNIDLPSPEMETRINKIASDRSQKLESIVGDSVEVIPYSATRGFNLEKLFNRLILAIPETRRWIYDGLKDFSYRDFIPRMSEAKQIQKTTPPPSIWQRLLRRLSK